MRPDALGLLGGAVLMLVLPAGCGGEEAAKEASSTGSARAREDGRAAFYATLRAAALARRAGDLEEEIRLLRQARAYDPDHEGCLVDLAHALRKRGEREEALTILARLRTLRPDLPRPHFLTAELLVEPTDAPEADLRRALALYREASRIEPNVSGPHLGAARTLRRLGRPEEAERAYRTVLGTNPDSGEALRGLGTLLLERGAHAEAIPFLVRALELGTRAKGRADVPSEMDTQESFDAGSLEQEPNRSALEALAQAARALGGYPPEVPARFRLR